MPSSPVSHYARVLFDALMIIGPPTALLAVVRFCEEDPRNDDQDRDEERDREHGDDLSLAA